MKKVSITKATNSIGGFSGRGAYKYSEAGGDRCMSRERSPIVKRGEASHGGHAPVSVTNRIGGESGKGPLHQREVMGSRRMSSAHGTNGQSKDNNMNRNLGNHVGKDCPGFRRGIPGEAHARHPIAGHEVPPKGNKSLSKGHFGGKR